MERVQGYEYEMDVFRRNLLQPAAQQLERVQSDEYAQYVLARIFFQPAAQQVERVQRDGYEFYVWTVRLLQPAASRSLVLTPSWKISNGKTFNGQHTQIMDFC